MSHMFAQNEEGWRWAAWENLKMMDRHNQEYGLGSHRFAWQWMPFWHDECGINCGTLGASSPQQFNKKTVLLFSCSTSFWLKTNEDFRWVVVGIIKHKQKRGNVFPELPLAEITPAVDGREKGCVSPLKDQVGQHWAGLPPRIKPETNWHACLGALWNSAQFTKF